MACTPASIAFGGVENGLSPISSSMTSLPAAISRFAIASTLNALSTPTDEANWLNAGIRKGMITSLRNRRSNAHALYSFFDIRFSFSGLCLPRADGQERRTEAAVRSRDGQA